MEKRNILACGGTAGVAVDLGLSVKWASHNVGASNPEEMGNRYAWGETETKEVFDWSTYKHLRQGGKSWKEIAKYTYADNDSRRPIWYDGEGQFVGDGKSTLEAADDAATAHWGGDWRMPTVDEMCELEKACKLDDAEYNGVWGHQYTGPNGNSIFLPSENIVKKMRIYDGIGGDIDDYLEEKEYTVTMARYWSSSLNEENCCLAYELRVGESPYEDTYPYQNERCLGRLVRGVCRAGGDTNGHEAIDLGLPSGMLWATRNIGAEEPEDAGSKFAWGETTPKEDYRWDNYAHMLSGGACTDNINKYQTDDGTQGGVWYDDNRRFIGDWKTKLEPQDDVATQSWGKEWRMPTKDEIMELLNNCTVERMNYEGATIRGIIFRSKINMQAIFLPIDGSTDSDFIWTSEMCDVKSGAALKYLVVYTDVERCLGGLVRPVSDYPEKRQIVRPQFDDVGLPF